jgi:hypothetical protein
VGVDRELRLELLRADHDLESIVCYPRSSEDYLTKQALVDQQSRKSRTYISCRGGLVVAYFTVAAGSVEAALSTAAISKRRRRSLFPVVIIARLGVDVREEGHDLEEAVLVQALVRCAVAADTFGARVVVASAHDPERRALLERFGLEPLPASPFHMFVAVEDVLASVAV